MVELDKLKIFNSFITVVRLIKGVRKDLTTEIDAIKSQTSAGINDESESTESVWSSSKVKQFVTDTVNGVIGGADENSDTLAELAEAIKTKAATVEGLLSVTAKQELTDAQKQTALENLGITKEFLVKLLVDDNEVSDSNLWSSRKVDTLIKDSINDVVTGELATDEEVAAALANVSGLPTPEKAGQVLVTVLEDNEVVTKWVDQKTSEDVPAVTEPKEPVTDVEPSEPTEYKPVTENPTPAEPSEEVTEPATGESEPTTPPTATGDQPSSPDEVTEETPVTGGENTEEVPPVGENTETEGTAPDASESTPETTEPVDNAESDTQPEEENKVAPEAQSAPVENTEPTAEEQPVATNEENQ